MTNDLAILDRIFDGNAHLYGKNEVGEVLLRPIARYRAVLASRQSPEKLGAPRQQEILTRDKRLREVLAPRGLLRFGTRTWEVKRNPFAARTVSCGY